jgi:hypothetical protein
VEKCKRFKKSDYQKALDSVPHSWLLQALNIYKIAPILIKYIGSIVYNWKTNLIMNSKDKNWKQRK